MKFIAFFHGLEVSFFPDTSFLYQKIDLLSKADLFNALFKHVISSHWQVLTRRALGKQVLDNIDVA
jgi:hypothetical protein